MFRPSGRRHSPSPSSVQLTQSLTDRPAIQTLQQDLTDRPAIDSSQPERSVEEGGNSGSQPDRSVEDGGNRRSQPARSLEEGGNRRSQSDRSVEEGGSSSVMGARWEMFGQQRGILRLLEILLCVVLIAMVGHGGGGGGGPSSSSCWSWCLFSWAFCLLSTLVTTSMELCSLERPLRALLDWDDLTVGLVLLDVLLVLSASVIYPAYYACWSCPVPLVAATLSTQCTLTFALEGITAKQEGGGGGSRGGYMSTLPGFLKVTEAFVACLIFVFLTGYQGNPGMEWCVIVYSVCFPLTVAILVLSLCPAVRPLLKPVEVFLAGFHALAVLLYTSAATLWPVFSFQDDPGPSPSPGPSPPPGHDCPWENLVVVATLTCVNLVLYFVDLIFSLCGLVQSHSGQPGDP